VVTDSVTWLTPVSSGGTVWGGGWNGSQWLISGWGDDGPNDSDPYIYLYDGRNQVIGRSLDQYQAESTWRGGDVFAASANGSEWLLSGLGSGDLPAYGNQNHMALALFNGSNFTDLSSSVPEQQDGILYANGWNGEYWLVGGGYDDEGILFSFDGRNSTDLTALIARSVPTFSSVQSLAWNGYYWLIGGVNFLATYDGHRFTDLTNKLDLTLDLNGGCCSSVNAIAWDGAEWMLGGGVPVAQTGYYGPWLVQYSQAGFRDLTSQILPPAADLIPAFSSILSITATDGAWIIGGYTNGEGSLYQYSGGQFTNLSYLVRDFTYVNWVGASTSHNRALANSDPSNPCPPESPPVLRQSEGLTLKILRLRASSVSAVTHVQT
jgi:hypothetical protein